MAVTSASTKNQPRTFPAKNSPDATAVGNSSLALRTWAWLQTTLGLGLLGSLLMYLAQPPCKWWLLAWIAPVPWLLLCRQAKLVGRRPYRALWLAGFVFWLGAIHWLRLPHWITYFGWLALSFYLAFYVPVFVGLVRVAVQRLGISIVVAAPVVWTGLELARGHLLSGFTMGALSHTQVHWLAFIQIADVIGDYGTSGLVMLVAACIARTIPWRRQRFTLWPIAPLPLVLAGAVVYGSWRTAGVITRPGPTVALIQGSIDVEVKTDEKQLNAVLAEYLRLSKQALQEQPNLDLLVWPETMYPNPLYTFAPGFQPPTKWENTPEEMSQWSLKNLHDMQEYFHGIVEDKFNAPLPPPLLIGIDAAHYSNEGSEHSQSDYFNSALFVDSQGNPLARYDKMHPVMFGEYIPLAEYLPFLYKITPLTGGLTSGTKAVSQKLGDFRYAPNICYETVVPHLIRRQVWQLRAQGEEPDVLVNITNDGWFRGSSELDMHLACGVFRAVEMRKPLLIAANTGFSAWIDSDGRIVQQGPRRAAEVIIAQPELDSRRSFYLDHGDLIPGLCLAGCLGLAAVGLWDWRSRRRGKPDMAMN
ncbi:MAG TPA: apolipoprotein N-acyltransferase [Pirellulales bacterium]|jgi:apolipoprotein N-acyltransferase|nr:apolipoprotein N-acyltransferase [Pirellulales bacterium]